MCNMARLYKLAETKLPVEESNGQYDEVGQIVTVIKQRENGREG